MMVTAALFAPKVHHHGTHAYNQSKELDPVQRVAVKVNTGHECSHFPREPDDAACQCAKLGNGDKDKDLAKSSAQAKCNEQESHVLTHLPEDVHLIEDDQSYACQDGLAELNIIHKIERSDAVNAHELVFVGACAAVKAKRYEQQKNAHDLRRTSSIVLVRLSSLVATVNENGRTKMSDSSGIILAHALSTDTYPPIKRATPRTIMTTLTYFRSGYFFPKNAPIIMTGTGLQLLAKT